MGGLSTAWFPVDVVNMSMLGTSKWAGLTFCWLARDKGAQVAALFEALTCVESDAGA
jgi:hypothetical protein